MSGEIGLAAALAAATVLVASALSSAWAMDRWAPSIGFAPDPPGPGIYEIMKDVQFGRHVACQLSSNPHTARDWPVPPEDRIGNGSGDGTRILADDDGNKVVTTITLFQPVDELPPADFLVCRGSIMANGRDVTLYPADESDVLVVQIGNIASYGWPTVSPALDKIRLAAVESAPPGVHVHAEGMIAMRKGDQADFDTNAEQETGDGQADLWFDGTYLTPLNGAMLAPDHPASTDCKQANFSADKLAFTPASVPPGSYICMRTSEGHIAELNMIGADADRLSISYTTYE